MTQTLSIERNVLADWVADGSSVLDLGCGDGKLLAYLITQKHVKAQGIELSDQAVTHCVAQGLSVFQQDIDTGLSEYSDGAFDFVVLNQTLQQVKKPAYALAEALRVGKKVIVGIPNFAYYKARASIFFRGRVPVTASLPYQWYDTPNLHFLSLLDFKEYCKSNHIAIQRSFYVAGDHAVKFWPNLFAEVGYFLLAKPQV